MTTIKHAGVPVAVVPTEPTKKIIVAMIASGTLDAWERGKEAGRRLGLDVVPPNFECEKTAGGYVLALDAAPSEPGAALVELIGALREMVYETTHLSPQEDDGSHICKISADALSAARAALAKWEIPDA